MGENAKPKSPVVAYVSKRDFLKSLDFGRRSAKGLKGEMGADFSGG
jgi:hypothetical protein